jgi:Uma2 family endonuclease
MPRTVVTVGPGDHGRRMSLSAFNQAEAEEGHLYELGRGVVVVVDVPDARHFAQVDCLHLQLAAYRLAHPGQVHRVGGGSDCKILLSDLESERHPDLAAYKTPPPEGEDLWARWVPEVVVEVVSPSSVQRDYEEKPSEYLLFGVREYWILDADRREMLVLRRRGRRWVRRVVRPPQTYQTALLPGLGFSCEAVFDAADAVEG